MSSDDGGRNPRESSEAATGRIRRVVPLIGLTARTVGGATATSLRHGSGKEARAKFHEQSAERYAELLGSSKGVLMKAGQMLSFAALGPAIPAEMSAAYQAAFGRLRGAVPPMAPSLIRSVLESEFGCPAESVFAEFDWAPLGAASIGQVHPARLHDGRRVAVKIQYPGVADAVRDDLKNAELLATFVALFACGLSPRRLSFDLRGAARELGDRISEELDYRHEASNQARFAAHYRGHPFIHVPAVVRELCTERVLTQDLAEGLTWKEAVAASQPLRDQWGEAIWRFTYGAYKRMLMINADPHPGNYIFHPDGSVTFLDFGCVKRFEYDQVQMCEAILRMCLRGDALGIWRASIEAGFINSSDPVTPDEVLAHWRDDWALLWAPKRFVVTPDYVARRIERRCSPNGPSGNAVRHIKMSPDYTLMGRIEVGVDSVIGGLRAGAHWGAIAAEGLEGATAMTEMGRREQAFLATG